MGGWLSDEVVICSDVVSTAATSVGSSTKSIVAKLSEPISFFAKTIVLVFLLYMLLLLLMASLSISCALLKSPQASCLHP